MPQELQLFISTIKAWLFKNFGHLDSSFWILTGLLLLALILLRKKITKQLLGLDRDMVLIVVGFIVFFSLMLSGKF